MAASAADGLTGRAALALSLGLVAGWAGVSQLHAKEPTFSLRGTVVLGPTCGGPNLEGPGCSQVFADAPLVVHDATGMHLVAQMKSGSDGRFDLNLPAGRYRLGVQTPKVTRCALLDIELPAMQGKTLTVDCDTGRR
jgi:hypothetical protein